MSAKPVQVGGLVQRRRIRGLPWPVVGLGFGLYLGLAIAISASVPVGLDFGQTFYAASQAMLAGQSPYSVPTFLNPPWAAVLFLPLALFPIRIAWGLFTAAGILIYLLAFYRARLSSTAVALIMLSPFVWFNLYYGNIDWLILVGVTLPPQYGIWLVLIKPQMAAVYVLFWMVETFHRHGWRGVLKTYLPAALAFGLSFVYILADRFDLTSRTWGVSAWPVGVALGVALTGLAYLKHDRWLALSASPFLSPYMSVHSWVVTMFPLAARRKWLVVFVVLVWIAALIRFWPGAPWAATTAGLQ